MQVGASGKIERSCGDAETLVILRSAVKPFTLIALVESGAADEFELTKPELALLASSHSGEDLHVRTLQAVFRRAGVSQALLACGTEGMPLDALTAARLARDGDRPSPIRHMCSGYHAVSILLSRHAGWSLEDYWRPEHPSQRASRNALARVFGVKADPMQTAVDSCGLLTYAFPLADLARAYALLAEPTAVAGDGQQGSIAKALTRIRDAMLASPEMVAGTRDRLDTALGKALPGRLIAKGGAEGVRGVALMPGSRGPGSGAAGLALKIEDGDRSGRASHAVTMEALWQLRVVDERTLRQLGHYHRPPSRDPRGGVSGEAVPDFQLAPILELL